MNDLTKEQIEKFKEITGREYNGETLEACFESCNDKLKYNVYFKYLNNFGLLCFETSSKEKGTKTYTIDQYGKDVRDYRFLEVLDEKIDKTILNLSKDNLDRLVKVKYH